jgi:uncharacterized membrane protein
LNWVLFWLFLHVFAVVLGLGPTYAFAFIGMATERHPQMAHFSAELMHKLETGLVLPLALTLPVSGIGLIISSQINLTKSPWLAAGILLYLVALGLALGILLPNTKKLVEATAGGPPPGPPAEGAPAGPPPHVARLVNQNKLVGMINAGLVVVIMFLMIVKPGAQ